MNDILSDARGLDVREAFIDWQCRIRQIAMRDDLGRPSSGMAPRVTDADGAVILERMVTLLVPRQPFESTTFFRHQVRKSHDRREVMEKGLTYLQSTHFQRQTGFRDEVTAVFGPASGVAEALIKLPSCILEYAQFNQSFRVPCAARALAEESDVYQATLWHNRLFNPQLPDRVTVLGFRPNWATADVEMPN